MKKILIVLLFIASPLQAEKIEQLSWYNLQELLEDDKLTIILKILKLLARPRGFEPLTLGLENRCSIQLS